MLHGQIIQTARLLCTFLMLCLLQVQSISAQNAQNTTDSLDYQEIEEVYAALRPAVLTGVDFQAFTKLIERLKRHSNGRRELSAFLSLFSNRIIHRKGELKSFKAYVKEERSEYFHLARLMRERDIEVLNKNRVVLDLINNNLIDFTNDHSLLYKESIIKEVRFYDLDNVSSIGEIGAGDGFYSRFLSMIYPRSKFYINEIDTVVLSYIKSFEEFSSEHAILQTNCEVALGNTTSINIHSHLDRIIIRNSFHHFSYPDEMIASMKEILTSDGQICVKEYPKRIDRPNGCDLRITEEEILSRFSKNGMKLVARDEIRSAIFLKFEIDE